MIKNNPIIFKRNPSSFDAKILTYFNVKTHFNVNLLYHHFFYFFYRIIVLLITMMARDSKVVRG